MSFALRPLAPRTPSFSRDSASARYLQCCLEDWRVLFRLTVARMYGRSALCDVSVVPCITECNTFGIIDDENGTAWDSRVPSRMPLELSPQDKELLPVKNSLTRSTGPVPPGWQRMASVNLMTDLVPRPLFRRSNWIRPTLRAIGLLNAKGVPGAPRRTLHDLAPDEDAAAEYPNGVPPWVFRKKGGEPIQLDWLPSKIEGLHGAATLYAYNKLVRIIDRTPWPTALAAALKEQEIAGCPPERFASSLISNLSTRLQLEDRELIATLHEHFIEAFEFVYGYRDVYCLISPLIYPNGPIFLEMPAMDARNIVDRTRFSPLCSYQLRDVVAAIRRGR